MSLKGDFLSVSTRSGYEDEYAMSGITASDILNTYEAAELTRLFREYGEIKEPWKNGSEIIIDRRAKEEIIDYQQL